MVVSLCFVGSVCGGMAGVNNVFPRRRAAAGNRRERTSFEAVLSKCLRKAGRLDGWGASAAWVGFGRTNAIQGIQVDTPPPRLPFVDMS